MKIRKGNPAVLGDVCHGEIDFAGGRVAIDAIVPGLGQLPAVSVTYHHPGQEDSQTILELDAHSWAEQMEAKENK